MSTRSDVLNGGKNINAADGAFEGRFWGFSPDQDTIIDEMTGVDNNGDVVNFETEFNITNKTLKAGSLYGAKEGWVITLIHVDSGAVVAYETY